ncbi:hypothetical protein K438DRAFT_1075477 [Mycena galopus ATCC 62051]|nr:hypothetical protein K438DRAFT_1075477 [Mycena galopus ATCC 62051]
MDAVPSNAPAQIFVENETSIKFFVDIHGIPSRGRLIRTLQTQGASVETDPKAADLILVQSDDRSGQHYIRVWGSEKPVLESTWVSKAITAGRLLKEADEWGGCLAVEDSSMGEDSDQNPLPTPRITPVETNAQTFSVPFQPPPNAHSPRHSQQPFPMNEPPNIPPAPFQQPIFPNQMLQYAQQPGVQQPFQPYGAAQPQPFANTGIQLDQNVYLALVDMAQRGLLAGYGGAPSGPQNGMHPGFANPVMGMGPMQSQQFHQQPPGLIPPVHHQYSASPPISARQSPRPLKGKGKAASYDPRPSSRPSSSSNSVKTEKIFTTQSGQPLTFYVAIDVKKRADILNTIKRNGGQISTQTTADFAILSFRSKDFDTLLETVLSCNGTAVKPAFVLDCVEENMLLDSTQYEYDVPQKLLRKAQNAASAAKPKAASSRKGNARKTKEAVAVKAERSSPVLSAPSRPHPPSPSPPPEHTRVLFFNKSANNVYYYTQEEDQYTLTYIKALFARDAELSMNILGSKLHGKMPHHSTAGWITHLKGLEKDIEELRKRARIALRKEAHEQSQQSNANVPPAKRRKLSGGGEAVEQAAAASPSALASGSGQTGPQATAAAEEQDLITVTRFFANGDAAGDEDHWQKLTEKTRCRTEASWEVFYEKHHEKVAELYAELVPQEESG